MSMRKPLKAFGSTDWPAGNNAAAGARLDMGIVGAGTENALRVTLVDSRWIVLTDSDGESVCLTSEQAGTLAAILRGAADRCNV